MKEHLTKIIISYHNNFNCPSSINSLPVDLINQKIIFDDEHCLIHLPDKFVQENTLFPMKYSIVLNFDIENNGMDEFVHAEMKGSAIFPHEIQQLESILYLGDCYEIRKVSQHDEFHSSNNSNQIFRFSSYHTFFLNNLIIYPELTERISWPEDIQELEIYLFDNFQREFLFQTIKMNEISNEICLYFGNPGINLGVIVKFVSESEINLVAQMTMKRCMSFQFKNNDYFHEAYFS